MFQGSYACCPESTRIVCAAPRDQLLISTFVLAHDSANTRCLTDFVPPLVQVHITVIIIVKTSGKFAVG